MEVLYCTRRRVIFRISQSLKFLLNWSFCPSSNCKNQPPNNSSGVILKRTGNLSLSFPFSCEMSFLNVILLPSSTSTLMLHPQTCKCSSRLHPDLTEEQFLVSRNRLYNDLWQWHLFIPLFCVHYTSIIIYIANSYYVVWVFWVPFYLPFWPKSKHYIIPFYQMHSLSEFPFHGDLFLTLLIRLSK